MLILIIVACEDPKFPINNDNGLGLLETSIEESHANAPQSAIVGSSLNNQVDELNAENIFVVDLSDEVSSEQLRSSLEFAENHVNRVTT